LLLTSTYYDVKRIKLQVIYRTGGAKKTWQIIEKIRDRDGMAIQKDMQKPALKVLEIKTLLRIFPRKIEARVEV
jgi:1,4-dihydroxy-2-naphthoyl-CoA synthase